MNLGSICDYLAGNDRYLIKILLITCKKAITRTWCKTDPPTVEQWLEIVRKLNVTKKLTSQLRLRENVFVSKWKKWMNYDTVRNLYSF